MPGELLDVNGTRVFVDVRGVESAPVLLYIHGGPGQGCYDFMRSQGDRLAADLRVVGVDQRGVLRSDVLPKEPALSVDLLIEDFEEIRTALGITSWTVLGHSAGGGYALPYAVSRPRSVHAAIFDCPCWDSDLTDRLRLPVVAEKLTALGKPDEARVCAELAAKPERLTAADNTHKAMQALGDDYLAMFFCDPADATEFARSIDESGIPEELWERGTSHQPLMANMYQSKVDLLPQLQQPALLLHGRTDLVVSPAMIELFAATRTNRTVRTFERSGHFSYLEQPEEYAKAVTAFAFEHAR